MIIKNTGPLGAAGAEVTEYDSHTLFNSCLLRTVLSFYYERGELRTVVTIIIVVLDTLPVLPGHHVESLVRRKKPNNGSAFQPPPLFGIPTATEPQRLLRSTVSGIALLLLLVRPEPRNHGNTVWPSIGRVMS